MKKLIYSQEDVDLMISIEIQQYQEDLEYEQYCNKQLRNKITNLENKIKRLEEDNKYKQVIDKIKEIITSKDICIDTRKTDGSMDYIDLKQIISDLLEEIYV